jgi:flagellar M-ring protein FliF
MSEAAQRLANLGGAVKKFSPAQKVSIALVALALILSGVLYIFVFNRTDYAPLFNGLSPQDSGMVVEQLKAMKIEYQLGDGGTSILVPADKVDELRIQLASQNALPSDGKGFELFDQMKFGLTDTETKIMYLRALEGELQRSINSLNEVESSRVHIVMPEESVFVEEAQPAKASIILKLKPYAKMDAYQVKAIIALVAGSVQGLEKENVEVVDTNLNYLSQGIFSEGSMGSADGTLKQMEIERQFEGRLSSDIKSMLEKALGQGKVAVQVNADLNFDSVQRTTITYDQEPIVKSQKAIQENRIDGGMNGGSPTDNNMLENNGGGENSSTYSRQETVVENEIGEVTETQIIAPGEVRRLSTSILIDGNLSPAKIDSIRNIVMAATNYDEARGDMISIEAMPFDTTLKDQMEQEIAQAEAAAKAAEERRQKRMLYFGIPAAAVGLILLIVLLVVISRGIRRRRRERARFDVTLDEPVKVGEIAAAAQTNHQQEEFPEEVKIREYAKEHIEEVTEVIKTWLAEDER